MWVKLVPNWRSHGKAISFIENLSLLFLFTKYKILTDFEIISSEKFLLMIQCNGVIYMLNKKILYVNCCVRNESRTNRIAQALLSKMNQEYEELNLYEEKLAPLTKETLEQRTNFIKNGDYSSPMFKYAKQFAKADIIVISAPYWDLSFPAELKIYIENIYVTGITSKYGYNGVPIGMCKAEKLYYVTTAGGPYLPDYSYDYIKELAKCFGIMETELIKVEMLDVDGFVADELVSKAINDM